MAYCKPAMSVHLTFGLCSSSQEAFLEESSEGGRLAAGFGSGVLSVKSLFLSWKMRSF